MERVNRHTNYTRDSSVQRAKFMSLMIYDGYVWFDMQAEFFFSLHVFGSFDKMRSPICSGIEKSIHFIRMM